MGTLGRLLAFLLLALSMGIGLLANNFFTNQLKYHPVDLTNKVCMVTGASATLGLATAIKLAEWGCKLELPLRSKAKETEDAIRAAVPNAIISIYPGVDFVNLKSVKSFAQTFVASKKELNVLVNNAGVQYMYANRETVDGIEEIFQVNYLAPHLLTETLIPAMNPVDSRVVFLSSIMALQDPHVNKSIVSFEAKGKVDYLGETGARYYLTKLLGVMDAKNFAKKYPSIIFTSVHPGMVRTDLFRHESPFDQMVIYYLFYIFSRSIEQGAVPAITLATHPNLTRANNGNFYMDYCVEDLCATCRYCDANEGHWVGEQHKDLELMKWVETETDKYMRAV